MGLGLRTVAYGGARVGGMEVTHSTVTGQSEFCQYKLNFYLSAIMILEPALIRCLMHIKPSARGLSLTAQALIEMEW